MHYFSKEQFAHIWLPRILHRELLCILAILLLQPLSSWSGAATFVVLIAWAVRSSRCAIQALSVGVLISFASHAFVPTQQMVSLFRWLLLFGALVRVSLDDPHRPYSSPRWALMLGLFVSVTFTFALFVSHDPIISLLKLLSFAVGVGVCLLAFRDRRAGKRYFLNWFYTAHIAVLSLSFPTMFVPAGYVTGFQGILSHPQTFGVYLVPMTAYITALIAAGRATPSNALVGAASWCMMIASGSRTAVLATCLALFVAVCSAMISRKPGYGIKPVALAVSAAVIALSGICLLEPSNGEWLLRVERFVTKQQRVTGGGSVASILNSGWSRGEQVSKYLALIRAHPLTGVGFGLDSEDRNLGDGADNMLGVPLTTATEPGFIYAAVPAQVGLVGSAFFLFLLMSLLEPVFAARRFPLLVAALAGLCVNNGEMIIFSMGGLGLQLWLFLAWAHESCLRPPIRTST